jgi:hypothetical protein
MEDQFFAARTGDTQRMRELMTVHNVNDVIYRTTALHFAAWHGFVDCCNVCLDLHANVDVGSTPLHHASLRGYDAVVRVLLDAGASIDIANDDGFTPLHRAIHNRRYDVAQLLIDYGAKLSNVLLGTDVQAIPHWIHSLLVSRSNCRNAAIIIVGIHKYHYTKVTGNNDINVMKLISKFIWSSEWMIFGRRHRISNVARANKGGFCSNLGETSATYSTDWIFKCFKHFGCITNLLITDSNH